MCDISKKNLPDLLHDLLPCPFCGGSADILYKNYDIGYFAGEFSAHAECTKCRVKTETLIDDNLESVLSIAASYWNQRVDVSKYPTSNEKKLYRKLVDNASTIGFYEGLLEGLTMLSDEVSDRIRKQVQTSLKERKEKDDSVAEW